MFIKTHLLSFTFLTFRLTDVIEVKFFLGLFSLSMCKEKIKYKFDSVD
jgi:hypothetical protein